MRHISYAESEFTTDEHLATLLLEYAALLARSGSADTVSIPGRVGGGAVHAVSVLVGPASQMVTWVDDEPFGEDVGEAVDDLEHRIRRATASIGTSDEHPAPAVLDDFDELA